MMDESENEFLPHSIVKSFHCHRRAYEELMNERASVRNALPRTGMLLISPRATARVLIKVTCKNSRAERMAEAIKEGRPSWRPKVHFCKHGRRPVHFPGSRGSLFMGSACDRGDSSPDG